MVDLVFSVRGETIAADYAQLLWDGLCDRLPWLEEEEDIGVHRLSGVSGHNDQTLYLNRRARLVLRLPAHRVAATDALSGATLDLGGVVVVEGQGSVRPLAIGAVLYAPFVCVGRADEIEFLDECRRLLRPLVAVPHMVCGKAHSSSSRAGELRGFSLMLHGLARDESLALQRQGLGDQRKLGCGLFVAHKAVAAVGDTADGF
jgi:CRISPR-associated protein Cas6